MKSEKRRIVKELLIKLKELKSQGVPKGESATDLLTKVIDEHFRANVGEDGNRDGLTKIIYAEVFQDLRSFAGAGAGAGAGGGTGLPPEHNLKSHQTEKNNTICVQVKDNYRSAGPTWFLVASFHA